MLALIALVLSLSLYGLSSAPEAEAGPANFVFSGSGWGHAVGMSQWGARGLAASGQTADQILAHYYKGTTVGSGHPVSNNVRVLLTQKQSSVKLTPSAATSFGQLGTTSSPVTATRSGNQIVLTGGLAATTPSNIDIALNPATKGVTVSSTSDAYRFGTMRIALDPAGGLRVIVGGMSMQQYLYGLGEMPSSWPAAALQTQAIASRTYAQKQIEARQNSSLYPDFDLWATTTDQSYRGTRFESESTHSNWTNAVDSSNGRVVQYGGKLIDAVYSASSGGYTEDSEFVWVSTVPYLRSVADPADLLGGNPNAAWSRQYSSAELGSWFAIGTVTSIEFLDPPRPSGHLDKSLIRLNGTGGTKTVTGTSLRGTINSKAGAGRDLRSTKFTISGSVSGAGTPNPTAPPPPATTPPPKPTTMATGSVRVASATGKTVRIAGTVNDPDGAALVRIVSTMGPERAVRDRRASNGRFDVSWVGNAGTRNVCVTIYDVPTNRGVSLGCRNVVVK